MATLPILLKPDTNKKHIIYLLVSSEAISAVLVQEEMSELRPVYFVSQVLHDPEMRYQMMEKVALTLVNVAHNLCQHFQSYRVTIRTDYPIAKILYKPELTRRMMAWSIELSKYEIVYEPRWTIQTQVRVDFVNKQCECMNTRF